MDTTRTHDADVFIGQRWADNDEKRLGGVVVRITEKNIVILDPAPKMCAYRRVHIEELRAFWHCTQPVELKEYMQNGTKYAIQVFVPDPHSPNKKRVFGQLKL